MESGFKHAFVSASSSGPSPGQPVSRPPSFIGSIVFSVIEPIRNMRTGVVAFRPTSGSPPSNFFSPIYGGVYSIAFDVGPIIIDQGTAVIELFRNSELFSSHNIPAATASKQAKFLSMSTIMPVDSGDLIYLQLRNTSNALEVSNFQFSSLMSTVNKTICIVRIA